MRKRKESRNTKRHGRSRICLRPSKRNEGLKNEFFRIDWPREGNTNRIPGIMGCRDGFEREARLALAIKFFEVGRLTSGQSAQLAGLSRVSFLLTCSQWGVPVVNWD